MTNQTNDFHIRQYRDKVISFIDKETKELEIKLKCNEKDVFSYYMEFLVKEVCEIYNLKPVNLKNAYCKTMEVEAQDIVLNIMRIHSNFSNREVIRYFNKNNDSRGVRAKKRHDNIDTNIKSDRFYDDSFKKVEAKFLLFVEGQENTNEIKSN